MDELVKLVAGKAGISEDQARKAVETVLGFVKGRLPAPIAGQLDKAIGGTGQGTGGNLGDIGKTLGGIFGKK